MPKEEAGLPGYYLQTRVVRTLVLWMGPLLALAALAVLQALVPMPTCLRLLLLVALVLVFSLRRRIENTVSQRVYRAHTGRDAEWEVRDALAENLDERFYLLNDIVLPGRLSNIDHIVVGPSGVHAIETKGVIGDVDATGEKLLKHGYAQDEYIRRCKRDRERLRKFLKERLPGESRTYPIYPVIVFTRASEVRSRGTTDGVCVEDIQGLLALLEKYAGRHRLDELHRAQVFHALRPYVASAGKPLQALARSPGQRR